MTKPTFHLHSCPCPFCCFRFLSHTIFLFLLTFLYVNLICSSFPPSFASSCIIFTTQPWLTNLNSSSFTAFEFNCNLGTETKKWIKFKIEKRKNLEAFDRLLCWAFCLPLTHTTPVANERHKFSSRKVSLHVLFISSHVFPFPPCTFREG